MSPTVSLLKNFTADHFLKNDLRSGLAMNISRQVLEECNLSENCVDRLLRTRSSQFLQGFLDVELGSEVFTEVGSFSDFFSRSTAIARGLRAAESRIARDGNDAPCFPTPICGEEGVNQSRALLSYCASDEDCLGRCCSHCEGLYII